jgi:fatty acid desaturase
VSIATATADVSASRHERERSAALRIPGTLNLALVCTVIAADGALLWTASHASSWWLIAIAAVVFSYTNNTAYSLLHECVHGKLHPSRAVNEWGGRLLAACFPTGLTFHRLCHLGHHRRNRTEAERFDYYTADDNRFVKFVQWYGILTGCYWLIPPLGCVLMLVTPRALLRRVVQTGPDDQTGTAAMLGGVVEAMGVKMRAEILLSIAVQAIAWVALDLSWVGWLACYAAFAVNWSALQYADHAWSELDVENGAWNLSVGRTVQYIFLNYHHHLAHHQHPHVPWIHLGRFVDATTPRPSFLRIYLSMWAGPRPLPEGLIPESVTSPEWIVERLAAIDPRDVRLIGDARETYPDVRAEDCTHERLQAITRERGVDFATAFLYDRVRSEPRTRAFLERLARTTSADLDAARPRLRVLIAPGAFYREHPQFGSDGRVVREAASRLGLRVETIPSASVGTVRENALVVREWLARLFDERNQTEPVVLVSLSKGAADVRVALDQLGTRPPALRAWIQICGLVHGTPCADRGMASWWRRMPVSAYLRLRGGRFTLVEELAAGSLSSTTSALLAPRFVPPSGLHTINIVAFPMRRHLIGISRARQRYMAAWGPSDGLALLRDEIVEPGVTLPVWGTDHYFRLSGIPDVLCRVFHDLDRQLDRIDDQIEQIEEKARA